VVYNFSVGTRIAAVEIVLTVGIALAAISSWWLFNLIALGRCGCYCGPGKCECECGCKKDCPCYYRDRYMHNEDVQHKYH
jgi:hypothetical protein